MMLRSACQVIAASLLISVWFAGNAAAQTMLADPARMPTTAERVDFTGANVLAAESSVHGLCLRSTPNRSASGLYQQLNVAPQELTRVTWDWRADQLQATGDLRTPGREDAGAIIFFIFGEPSFFHRDVPTLAYAWSATPVEKGTVLPSLRYASLRYIQLEGRGAAGTWRHEERNVAADFRAVFGREPGPLHYIAVFNDNDQTGEPASALFCPILAAR